MGPGDVGSPRLKRHYKAAADHAQGAEQMRARDVVERCVHHILHQRLNNHIAAARITRSATGRVNPRQGPVGRGGCAIQGLEQGWYRRCRREILEAVQIEPRRVRKQHA